MDAIYIQKKLNDLCAQHALPALGCAVFHNGRQTILVSGIRKHDDPTLATTADKFHLGSCGKSVTAALIHQLVKEGCFALDAKLHKLLPHIKIDPAYQNVTVSELLTHSAGLPADFHDMGHLHELAASSPPADLRIKIAQEILEAAPSGAIKKEYSYSNIGYVLLGMIAETAAGKSYEELVQQKIFNVLGMTSAGFGAAADTALAIPDQPWGHFHDGEHRLYPLCLDNPPAYAPVGTMHASLGDWMKFFLFDMQQARITQNPNGADVGDGASIYTDSAFVKVGDAFMHDGSNTMNYARVVLLPKQNIAFVIASNDGSDHAQQAANELTVAIINALKAPTPKNPPKPSAP